jgi:macrolide transport system ATP-binding/permease protein
VRHGLAVAQIALLVVLLDGHRASITKLCKRDFGADRFSATTVTASVEMSSQYGNARKRRALFGNLIERLNSISGVQAVGVVNELPLSDSESLATLFVEGYPNTKQQLVEKRGITQDYLSAMQTPLVQGRDTSDEDVVGHRLVAVVNQAFAKKYFANEDAIGHLIRTGEDESDPWVTVAGVAKDVRYMSIEAAPVPQVYRSFWQVEWDESNIVGAYVCCAFVAAEGCCRF